MRRLALLALLAGACTVRAEEKAFTITVSAGKHDYKNEPVVVPLSLPATFKQPILKKVAWPGQRGLAQLTRPGITTESVKGEGSNTVRRDLHLLVPELKAGDSLTLTCVVEDSKTVGSIPIEGTPRFSWHDQKGEHAELRFGPAGVEAKQRPILRYMYRAYDNSKAARDLTYKVFHHVYDPEGKRLVTNGGQTDLKDGETTKLVFPHHRGLMYAFMRCTYGDGKPVTADTWHAKPGETHQSHTGFAATEAGPLLGRHRVLVDWHGPKNEVFAKEERELTVYNVPGGTLIEFASRLRPTVGKVKVDGDPQHAGFQFRAANDVAIETAKQTYYLRPDGKGKPGATRNWEPKTKKGPVNLPWDALSFVLDGKRYTVAYLNNPRNPGESRWSERDYGRFGCYFTQELTEDRPLVVDYRVWLQNGEMTVPEVQALSTGFVSPPTATVK